MKHEIRVFFTALMFYTRIPCPHWVDHSEEYINKSIRYFPVIGWIVGVTSGLIYLLLSLAFSPMVCLIGALVASILATGAFHEDGFTDVCDGFGGGWTPEGILKIMKDSRVGAYGVVGIGMLVALKIALLFQLIADQDPDWYPLLLVFIIGHTLSRFVALTFVFTHDYVREDATSKSKPVAKQGSHQNLIFSSLFAAIPLIVLCYLFSPLFALILIPAYLVKMYLGAYFKKWIGGYTGDCLGATQQVIEVIVYGSMIVVWKFI